MVVGQVIDSDSAGDVTCDGFIPEFGSLNESLVVDLDFFTAEGLGSYGQCLIIQS